MKIRLLLFLPLLIALPALAVTVTNTSGCNAPIAVTSTIDFGPTGSPNTTDPAGHATYTGATFNNGTSPGCGGSFLDASSSTITITFDMPIDYFGTAWGTPDNYNSLSLYDGPSLLGTYNNSVVTNEYVGFTAGAGQVFTKVVLSSSQCCFEMDNQSYLLAPSTVPEPSSLGFMLVAGAVWGTRRLRRRSS